MNFPSSFQIGRSALAAGQQAMNVAGNNMANAATAGFRRQRLGMTGIAGPALLGIGQIGNGVRTTGLTRVIDMALLARLRHSRADEGLLSTSQMILGGVEGTLASVGEKGLGGAVEAFLSEWSELAASPTDPGMRGVIVEQGVGLASQVRQLRQRLLLQRDEIDRSLQDGVIRVHQLLERIESLSNDIRAAESAGGSNPTLRDQRDLLVDELATLMDVTVVDRPDGTLDLLVGSTPIMLQGSSMGVSLSITQFGASFSVTQDGAPLSPGGSLGALAARRADGVDGMISKLDSYAHQLINAVNRVHIEGSGLHGRSSITSFIGVDDPTIPLAQNGLQYPVTAGVIRFQVHQIGSSANPMVVSVAIDPATDSLQQVATAINLADGIFATSVNAANQLVVSVPPGYEFSILEDQTGLFTAIQFGGFFTGLDASDIEVDQDLVADPQLLSVALDEDAAGAANRMAALRDARLTAFGTTLGDWWRLQESDLSARVRSDRDGAESSQIVRLGLEEQERQVSGVSVDEETMNLIAAQTQYEAAARFVSTLEEMLQTLLGMAAR